MKRLIKNVFAKLGYQIQGTRYCPRHLLDPRCVRTIEFDDLVCRRMFEFGQELIFIQVGAFDGTTRDPLRKYIEMCGWRGILVEPQFRACSELRELYWGNSGIVILQAAVEEKSGKRRLFTVKSETAPAWARGLASFERETIVKHANLIPGLVGMIGYETVDCITFNDVLQHLPSERLDLLQIDTEGADARILALFPFDRLQPAIVQWEVKHLSKAQREECFDRLACFGYRFAASGDEDMIAVLL